MRHEWILYGEETSVLMLTQGDEPMFSPPHPSHHFSFDGHWYMSFSAFSSSACWQDLYWTEIGLCQEFLSITYVRDSLMTVVWLTSETVPRLTGSDETQTHIFRLTQSSRLSGWGWYLILCWISSIWHVNSEVMTCIKSLLFAKRPGDICERDPVRYAKFCL